MILAATRGATAGKTSATAERTGAISERMCRTAVRIDATPVSTWGGAITSRIDATAGKTCAIGERTGAIGTKIAVIVDDLGARRNRKRQSERFAPYPSP